MMMCAALSFVDDGSVSTMREEVSLVAPMIQCYYTQL